ncbi:ABC transporter ATP-binding protein [Hoeflea prorocentri]|uniref:Dipeptide ABC transporter ATP-binding protein n=1 Tax=Hoeflea prorocentri TaxID=1922333 RepID=A0A9X3UMA7_9HYPH|nr:dipeptide ABC transporter ATP-binding protein [Hoeflea prorocentri]MCY6383030.1 dipeptide ABC transporter ATP-binding protein [Hoeflea prorocentri]MDA5400830.1 dipeptide ABC transporter ATP-binding protein [Hoeflea prorocentri]
MTVENSKQTETPILDVHDLSKHYRIGGKFSSNQGTVRALDGVSFKLYRGQTLGVVGESGCGKSTLARTLMRLVTPTSGGALMDGRDIFKLSKEETRQHRKKMQMIFQDPFASLNPRMTVADIITEPWQIFPEVVPVNERRERLAELLTQVGLNPNDGVRYPHQFSGGQKQRIGIARALALNPEVIVCDEPVSALDVSVQAQVINLLKDIQSRLGLSYVFIAHDLSVVRHISDQVAVMYLGKIVEFGDCSEIYRDPKHPYTKALLSNAPSLDPKDKENRVILKGELPSPLNPPSGCNFRTRCNMVFDKCSQSEPALSDRGNRHACACFLDGH